MIIDTLQNAAKYHSVHPLFEKAFAYIHNTDLVNANPGTQVLEDGAIKAIVSDGPAKTKEASLAKFECHDNCIDIQFCISGIEKIGWKPREKCVIPNGAYNPEKDVRFFNDHPDMYFTLGAGQYAIFFPEDVHAPLIGEGNIKKLVIKVRV